MIRLALLSAVLLTASGCIPRDSATVDPFGRDAAKAEYTLLAEMLQPTSVPSPTPDNPDGTKCENCDGTGEIGDGTVMVECPVCDGTGVTSEPMAEGEPLTAAVVEMVSQDDCPPCDAWWRDERPKWEKQGWRVTRIGIAGSRFNSTPSFVLKNGDRVLAEVEGWMTTDIGKRALGFEVAVDRPIANATHSGYGSWTFPGRIADHLTNPNGVHRFDRGSLAGMSQRDLELMHDSHHNEIRGGSSQVMMGSACPTGTCPTTTTRRRR